jgi:CBS domain-containing protein
MRSMLGRVAHSAINFQPIVLPQETSVQSAIAAMSRTGDRCVLVTHQTVATHLQLVGLFTAEDVVTLAATSHLADCSLQQVMTPPAQILNLEDISQKLFVNVYEAEDTLDCRCAIPEE